MTRPGVLLVGNFLSQTRGHRHYCEDLADRLEGAGWPVVRTSRVAHRLAKIADMARTVFARRHDYALAHVDLYSGSAFAWAELVCWELQRLGKPFVLTLHGGSLPSFAQRWPRRLRRLLASADRVTAPSRYLRDQLAAYAPHPIEVIPNGLALGRYTYAERTAPAPRIVWLRAFHEVYQPTLALDVLARIPRAQLTMVGPDRGVFAATVAHAQQLGVADRVNFVGPVPNADVPTYLSAADVFLNTTTADNTPVSVLEAMATGLPVVSTSVGGIPYLVRDGHDALLVPSGDVAAMTAAVERVLGDHALAARLSRNGRALAETIDWPAITARWTALLAEVARG